MLENLILGPMTILQVQSQVQVQVRLNFCPGRYGCPNTTSISQKMPTRCLDTAVYRQTCACPYRGVFYRIQVSLSLLGGLALLSLSADTSVRPGGSIRPDQGAQSLTTRHVVALWSRPGVAVSGCVGLWVDLSRHR